MPLDDLVAPMRERLEGLPFHELAFDAAGARDYLLSANWALYLDNYLEGFHIPYLHASLATTLAIGERLPYIGRSATLPPH
jgi:choline monooxygenase